MEQQANRHQKFCEEKNALHMNQMQDLMSEIAQQRMRDNSDKESFLASPRELADIEASAIAEKREFWQQKQALELSLEEAVRVRHA